MSNSEPNSGSFKPGPDPRRNIDGANRGSKWLTTQLAEALKKIGDGQSESFDVLLVKRVLKSAIVDGDMRAISHIWDRLEGKPVQPTDITSGGEKIAVNLVTFDENSNDTPQPDSEQS